MGRVTGTDLRRGEDSEGDADRGRRGYPKAGFDERATLASTRRLRTTVRASGARRCGSKGRAEGVENLRRAIAGFATREDSKDADSRDGQRPGTTTHSSAMRARTRLGASAKRLPLHPRQRPVFGRAVATEGRADHGERHVLQGAARSLDRTTRYPNDPDPPTSYEE
jgi:hypothetical protein